MFTLFSILSLNPPMCPPSNPTDVPQLGWIAFFL